MVGKPFNITVEVKETTKGDKTYKNVNVKTPVALAKKEIGKTESPLQPAVVVDMKMMTYLLNMNSQSRMVKHLHIVKLICCEKLTY